MLFRSDAITAAGQPIEGLEGGELSVGANLTVGEILVLSATAGKICPRADLVTGNLLSIIGAPKSTSLLAFGRLNTGVAVP